MKRNWSDWLFLIRISSLSRRKSPSWQVPSELHTSHNHRPVDKRTRPSQREWTKITNRMPPFLRDVVVHHVKWLHGNEQATGQIFPVPLDPTSIYTDFLKSEIQMHFERDLVWVKGYSRSLQGTLKIPQPFYRCSGTFMPICKTSHFFFKKDFIYCIVQTIRRNPQLGREMGVRLIVRM